jgi:hypothetical protein
MAQQTELLTELLLQQEKELTERLAAIKTLLGRSENNNGKNSVEYLPAVIRKEKKEPLKGEGLARGTTTWEKYVQQILKELGGKGKTQDVVQYATKANPKENQVLVLQAVRGKLSKLFRRGVLGADKGENKKDGYTFFLKSPDLFNR